MSNPKVDRINLSEGELSLLGRTDGGKNYELTGEIEEVRIEREANYPHVNSWTSNIPLTYLNEETYWLKFKRKKDGTAYTVQMETVDVKREAFMQIEDNSFRCVSAARALVGAPEEATVYVNESYVGYGVTFTWTEKMVK